MTFSSGDFFSRIWQLLWAGCLLLAFAFTVPLILAGTQPFSCDLQLADEEIVRQIEVAAGKLIPAEKTVSAKILVAQLSRTHHRGTLVSTPPAPRRADLYAHCRQGVLVMASIYHCGKCDDWHASPASGFVVSAEGLAVTNHHVIAHAAKNETILARTWDGKVYPVREILAASKAMDLALIRLDVGEDRLVALPVSKGAEVGAEVSVISHPVRRFYSMTRGIVSRHYVGRDSAAAKRMDITADFARGSSGAPVLNDAGQVVGVVSSTSSVYYGVRGGKSKGSRRDEDNRGSLQMVFKQCVPSMSLFDLFEPKVEIEVDTKLSEFVESQ